MYDCNHIQDYSIQYENLKEKANYFSDPLNYKHIYSVQAYSHNRQFCVGSGDEATGPLFPVVCELMCGLIDLA